MYTTNCFVPLVGKGTYPCSIDQGHSLWEFFQLSGGAKLEEKGSSVLVDSKDCEEKDREREREMQNPRYKSKARVKTVAAADVRAKRVNLRLQ